MHDNYVKETYSGLKEEIKRIERLRGKEDYYQDEDYREPLSIEPEIVVEILLSTGGPADGFSLHFAKGDTVPYKGYYYRANWSEYREEKLNDDELASVHDFYMYGEGPQGVA